ncbi:hypothetical protein FQN54_006324 [Arachnomyces sp. PD_36]|nr:hypothetical protein FQN54_006324 [Arachnomyces sp. PD_36]
MASQEENVLVISDLTVEDENDWEEFSLVDVKANLPGKPWLANVLTASENNPLEVSGRLEEVEDSQRRLVKDKNYRSKRIVINNVKHFAYGQHEDGEVGIWVAGQAGWFLISPGKGYKAVYKEMVEAIDLLYFLADQYNEKDRKKKRKRLPGLKHLYREYVYHTNRRCADADDAAEIFEKHRVFIMSQMFQGREGIDWESTPLYAHMEKYYNEEFESIKESVSSTQDMDISNEDERKEQAETIYETIRDMVDDGFLSRRQLNMESIAKTLTERHDDIEDEDGAIDLIRARASDLLEIMHNVPSSTVSWRRKALYRELQQAIESVGEGETRSSDEEEEEEEEGDEEGDEVNGEENQEEGSEEEMEEEEGAGEEGQNEGSSSDEESGEETPPPRGRRRRVRKSILRPMTVSAKGAGKRNKMIDPMDSDEDADDSDPETPTKRGGHELIHDPLSVRANGHKNSPNTRAIKNLSLRDSESPGQSDDDSAVEHLGDGELPPDTWTCLVEGCNKVVYKASSKRSKEIIEDHSLVHAQDTQSKVDLVLAEHRLNVGYSIDNLLSRIRGFETMQTDGGEIEDLPSPKRVKE